MITLGSPGFGGRLVVDRRNRSLFGRGDGWQDQIAGTVKHFDLFVIKRRWVCPSRDSSHPFLYSSPYCRVSGRIIEGEPVGVLQFLIGRFGGGAAHLTTTRTQMSSGWPGSTWSRSYAVNSCAGRLSKNAIRHQLP